MSPNIPQQLQRIIFATLKLTINVISEIMEVTEGASVCAPGFHKVELLRTTWEMPINYQEPQPLGVGAYGQVW